MDPNRVHWNNDLKTLRRLLKDPAALEQTKALFLTLHAPLHTASVSGSEGWNLEEELWQGLSEADFRTIPTGKEHSIAWCLWHLARIEDATMNVLIAETESIFDQENWKERLHCPIRDTGNLISDEGVRAISTQVAFFELRAYRSAVGKRTRLVVAGLSANDLKHKPSSVQLQHLLENGTVLPTTTGLLDYWGGLTFGGLLLMPPTRHALIHLNEALQLKKRAQRV